MDVLWATGLCHVSMKAMTDADFQNHHVVLTALNIHLFEHRVPSAVHEKTKKRVVEFESKYTSLEKRMNSLVGSVAALKKKQRD